MILTTQFNDVVKNAKVQWREGFNSVPKAARQMYDVSNVSEMTSEHSTIAGYGFARRKAEGEKYVYGSIRQGYTLNLSQTRIGLMDAITYEMRKFDKYREIDKKMRKLGETTAKRIELDLTHQFTFGMSASSYTNMDGETVSTLSADGQNIKRNVFFKSSLINGENLKTAFQRFMATLNKAYSQLQRLSERTLNLSDAIVRTV